MMVVLRIGHRKQRDARISTHCGLVARALGVNKIIYSGEYDEQLISSIKKVVNNWGGPFSVEYSENYRNIIKKYKKRRFCIIHLTMYGMPLQKKTKQIRSNKNVLIIIGAEKVPGDVYQMADYNIAVANQPHSEVASLAVLLHEYFKGKELSKKFKKARLCIVPMEKGKKVLNVK
jgi:tRNA (cytidine56-2'-O)-methyltransferase